MIFLQDEYGNVSGLDVEGKLVAAIVVPDGEGTIEMPNLVGGNSEVDVAMTRGTATLHVRTPKVFCREVFSE